MFIGNTTNLSPTRIFDVAGTLSGAFRAVELTKNGLVNASASSVPVGILIDGNFSDDATVQVIGGTNWRVGGSSISAGDLLASDDDGLAVKAQAGKFAFALALENAAADSMCEVQIVNAGFVR